MDRKNSPFKMYRRRLVAAAAISSAVYGLILGAAATFAAALIGWFTDFAGVVWLAVGVGAGIAIVAGLLFYFLKFRPTGHDVVRRIDSMGLEERTLTMTELEGADTDIARLQRQDAQRHLDNVSGGQVKAAFPLLTAGKAAVTALCAALCLGIGMTTVAGLTQAGVIDTPGFIDSEREKYVTVSYMFDEGGEILGETDQILLPGENAQPVVAVPEDGWIFLRWSDGNRSTERTDMNITQDLIVTAIFEEIGDGEDDSDGDAMENEGEEDTDQNIPADDDGDGSGSSGDGGDGGSGDGSGSSGEGSGSGEGGEEGQGNGQGQGDGSGGGWSDNNQVIDGETNYRDVLEQYYDLAMEYINSGEEIPPEIKEFIENYFNSL